MSSLAPVAGATGRVEPLTRDEIEFMNRILSDPTLFPREFKRWVTDHSSDSVDIAKSQVHGLVDKGGDVYIPAPPRVAELGFTDIVITAMSIPSGGSGTIASLANVPCDGNPVVLEFFIPFVEYVEAKFRLTMDAADQGVISHIMGPPVTQLRSRGSVYIQRQFAPSKANHNFTVTINPIGVPVDVVAGVGHPTLGDYYSPGLFRISRA